MSELPSHFDHEEINKQLEILNPIRDRQSDEILTSGIATRVINNIDQYQIFVNPPESLPPLNESSNAFVGKECMGDQIDRLLLYTTSQCGNCPYEHMMANYAVGAIKHEDGALQAVQKGLEKKDIERLSEMAQELIELRRSGKLFYPVLDEKLLTT